MSHYSTITPEQIRNNLQKRITETKAELQALKGVHIDTKHKTLTNRAITGEGARIDDYIGIGKALYVSYVIKYKDGSMRYASRDITAYSYQKEDGSEIGAKDGLRISRTITPAELQVILQDVKDGLASLVGELESEYRRAASIAKKHNALVDKINEFNKDLSYASEAQL
jgi:hypothetical protein